MKTMAELLKVEITKTIQGDKIDYIADAKILPGTPPIGKGKDKYEALYDLLSKILWEHKTWLKFVEPEIEDYLDSLLHYYVERMEK